MNQPMDEALAQREFDQMHDHMRLVLDTISKIVNYSVAGSTTFLGAALAFFSSQLKDNRLNSVLCLIFLLPIPFIIFSMMQLAAHRKDAFKMGYFIKVFYEEKYGGACWHVASDIWRKHNKGESFDSARFLLWSLFLCALFLYAIAIYETPNPEYLQTLVVPFLVFAMMYTDKVFMKGNSDIYHQWKMVEIQYSREKSTGNQPSAAI
jgi:hypothetical protein